MLSADAVLRTYRQVITQPFKIQKPPTWAVFFFLQMIHSIFKALFVAVMAAFLPFVTVNFLDAPYLQGFVSFDAFLVTVLLARKRGRLFWQLPWSLLAFGLAFYGNSIHSFAAGFLYLALPWIFSIPKKSVKIFAWVTANIFFVVANWSLFFEAAFSMSLGDLFGVAKFYWWGLILFFAVPAMQALATTYFARDFLFGVRKISEWAAFAAVCLILGVQAFSWKIQQRIVPVEFPTVSFFEQQLLPGRISHSSMLQRDISEHYPIILYDSLPGNLTPTVTILVESWGVRKNFALNDSEFNVFAANDVRLYGILERNSGHTQGAEWEDFGTPNGKESGKNWVKDFRTAGFETWYVHGYDAKFYDRDRDYPALGFDSLKFREDFQKLGLAKCDYGFQGICDEAVANFLDGLLDSVPRFVYWTTLDSHPPYETQAAPEFCGELSKIACIHSERIAGTLKSISELAKKHPNVRFVIRGDHRPMGSLAESDFVASFYWRWVPVVVLNN